jgi:hypothetical protein
MKFTLILTALFTVALAAPAAVDSIGARSIRPCVCKAPICPLEITAVYLSFNL